MEVYFSTCAVNMLILLKKFLNPNFQVEFALCICRFYICRFIQPWTENTFDAIKLIMITCILKMYV